LGSRERAPGTRSRLIAWAAVAAATVLALVSVLQSSRVTWHRLGTDYRRFSALVPGQRESAASEAAGFPASLFDLLSLQLRPHDRIYFQIPHTPYGTLDLHDTLAALGRYYLLPAVEVTRLDRATVVVSYEADPGRLGRRFRSQIELGNSLRVSRLAEP
jgi:hypothetical protein